MDEQPTTIQAEESPAPAPSMQRTLRLLLVDDDDATRIALGFILDKHHFDVTHARNGQEALGQATTEYFDVMLMDLHMPVMDGVRMLTMMKQSPSAKTMPVVVFSQHADRDAVKQCAIMGVRDFVVKQSLDVEQLIAKLREAAKLGMTSMHHKGAPQATEQEEEQKPQATDHTPAPDDPPLDQRTWKEKMASLGRVTREDARGMMQSTALPTVFPSLVHQICQKIDKGEAYLEQNVQDIEQEPALLVPIIGAANQSQASKTKAMDVETAIRWIGNTGVAELIKEQQQMMVTLPEEDKIWAARWWVHSIATAEMAGFMAPAMGITDGEARSAALLHDIGRLFMLNSELRQKLITTYDLGRNMAINMTFAEQSLLGINHKQAGEMLCASYHIPEFLANICETHDYEEAQRGRLDGNSQNLSALIAAADQLAKAFGFGSLPNDELIPMPQRVIEHCNFTDSQFNAAIAELQTLTTWRLGADAPESTTASKALSGLIIVMVTDNATVSNPYMQGLGHAGATVNTYSDLHDLLDEKPMHDLLIFDQTTHSLGRMLPMLRRLQHSQVDFGGAPRLLLARRSDDPQTILRQAGLDMNVYPTPIRLNSLILAVRRLCEGAEYKDVQP